MPTKDIRLWYVLERSAMLQETFTKCSAEDIQLLGCLTSLFQIFLLLLLALEKKKTEGVKSITTYDYFTYVRKRVFKKKSLSDVYAPVVDKC